MRRLGAGQQRCNAAADALLLPCAGHAAVHRGRSLPVDDDQEVFRRGDPNVGRRIAKYPHAEIRPADRRTVQLQFTWCVSRKLLDRNELAHGAASAWFAAVRRLFFPMMWLLSDAVASVAQDTAFFAFG